MYHHACPLELQGTEIKTNGNQGVFSGYASVFERLDEHGDRVLPGAFKKSLKNFQEHGKTPKMLWQHDPTIPIGQWMVLKEDAKGLYVQGKLLLNLQKAREAYDLLKEKIIDGLSIGYRVVEAIMDKDSGERLLTQVELVEVSLVTFAANKGATILSVKEGRQTNPHKTLQIPQEKTLVHRLEALTQAMRC